MENDDCLSSKSTCEILLWCCTTSTSYTTNTTHKLLPQHAYTWLLPEIRRGPEAKRKSMTTKLSFRVTVKEFTTHSNKGQKILPVHAPTHYTIAKLQRPAKTSSSLLLSRIIIINNDQASAEWGSQTLRQACYRENPESAMCVQNLNDSRGLAIRITYRISLRSSSLWEPRHPPLKVVLD